MTSKELFEAVALENEIDPRLAKKVCQSMLDIIKNELKNGNSVTISSFGVYETKVREARTGFNPKTRESLEIPAKRYPVFRAAKALKDEVSE
jgi:nucleoid DNA-binding protein